MQLQTATPTAFRSPIRYVETPRSVNLLPNQVTIRVEMKTNR